MTFKTQEIDFGQHLVLQINIQTPDFSDKIINHSESIR